MVRMFSAIAVVVVILCFALVASAQWTDWQNSASITDVTGADGPVETPTVAFVIENVVCDGVTEMLASSSEAGQSPGEAPSPDGLNPSCYDDRGVIPSGAWPIEASGVVARNHQPDCTSGPESNADASRSVPTAEETQRIGD